MFSRFANVRRVSPTTVWEENARGLRLDARLIESVIKKKLLGDLDPSQLHITSWVASKRFVVKDRCLRIRSRSATVGGRHSTVDDSSSSDELLVGVRPGVWATAAWRAGRWGRRERAAIS